MFCTRSSICSCNWTERISSGVPRGRLAVLESREKMRTLCLSKPVSTSDRFIRLRTNNPATTSSTTESATCPTISDRASAPRVVEEELPRPSLRAGVNSSPAARNAGSMPNRSAVTTAAPSVKPSTGMSGVRFNGTGLGPGVAMLSSTALAFHASATPVAAPRKASNSDSVRSCNTIRRRDAPSAMRIATSRVRATPRARSMFAIFAQAIKSTSATMAIRISSGTENA